MKNISLVKVTAAVFVTTVISSFVSADDSMKKELTEATLVAEKIADFSSFDVDKNGSLNQTETKTYKALHDAFAKVDANGDATISKDEFSAFVKSIK